MSLKVFFPREPWKSILMGINRYRKQERATLGHLSCIQICWEYQSLSSLLCKYSSQQVKESQRQGRAPGEVLGERSRVKHRQTQGKEAGGKRGLGSEHNLSCCGACGSLYRQPAPGPGWPRGHLPPWAVSPIPFTDTCHQRIQHWRTEARSRPTNTDQEHLSLINKAIN